MQTFLFFFLFLFFYFEFQLDFIGMIAFNPLLLDKINPFSHELPCYDVLLQQQKYN